MPHSRLMETKSLTPKAGASRTCGACRSPAGAWRRGPMRRRSPSTRPTSKRLICHLMGSDWRFNPIAAGTMTFGCCRQSAENCNASRTTTSRTGGLRGHQTVARSPSTPIVTAALGKPGFSQSQVAKLGKSHAEAASFLDGLATARASTSETSTSSPCRRAADRR